MILKVPFKTEASGPQSSLSQQGKADEAVSLRMRTSGRFCQCSSAAGRNRRCAYRLAISGNHRRRIGTGRLRQRRSPLARPGLFPKRQRNIRTASESLRRSCTPVGREEIARHARHGVVRESAVESQPRPAWEEHHVEEP